MKNLLLSLMFFFPASGAMAQGKPDKPAPESPSVDEKIRQLVEDLGADAYEVREKAQAALEKIGKPALEALRKALKGTDLEVSSRAEELIEKITGKKRAEPKKDGPAITPLPDEQTIPFSPDDMEGMLDKLKEFEGLSPNLKNTLDSFRKMLEGVKGNETPGLPDLGKLEELLEGFLDRGPEPRLAPSPQTKTKTAIEDQLGLEVEPIDDVLRSHLNIENGLVIKRIDLNGHAFKQGLRQYDIVVFISGEPAPKTPPGVQKAWRDKALKPGKAEQLGHLKIKSFVEVVRKGKSSQIEMAPLQKKAAKKEPGKKRDF
jgi:hypothetical protein